ncbi:MAG TPA: hypothetical protein PLY70_00775 [Saprospiraceae bacterium]|nr:hypothetical protein [Saprospiraceae bacterium]
MMNIPMLERSKGSVYENMAITVARSTTAFYGNEKNSSPTSVITETIVKIVNAQRPKTRYRVGKWAKPMVWMRVYLGDRLFDKILATQIK